MNSIRNFREHRTDGRIIPETMSPADLTRSGWPPCLIDEVLWDGPAGPISLSDQMGLLSNIVLQGRFLAVIGTPAPLSTRRGLAVVDAGASLRFQFVDGQRMPGTDVTGIFRWFDKPLIEESAIFSATIESPLRGMCRVFINVETEAVEKVLESR